MVRDAEAEGHPVTHVYGYAPWPDHNNRRCLDLMVRNNADLTWIARYVVRHADELRVQLVISDRRIWRSYRKGVLRARRWHRYFGKNPHRDHVHVQVGS